MGRPDRGQPAPRALPPHPEHLEYLGGVGALGETRRNGVIYDRLMIFRKITFS